VTEYHILWFLSIFSGLLSSLGVIAIGALLCLRVLGDLSNSTTVGAYFLRFFRLVPGVVLTGFGCLVLWDITRSIIQLHLPN